MKKWFNNFLRKHLWKRQSGLKEIDCKNLTISQLYKLSRFEKVCIMKTGELYITDSFEVVQHEGCMNGYPALLGKGETYEEALTILKERKEERKY